MVLPGGGLWVPFWGVLLITCRWLLMVPLRGYCWFPLAGVLMVSFGFLMVPLGLVSGASNGAVWGDLMIPLRRI